MSHTREEKCKRCGSIINVYKMKCQWCGSEDGHWSSIYDWRCNACGKVTVD